MLAHLLHERRDRVPARLARVELCRGARVHRDGRAALVLGDPPRVEERLEPLVDADPELDRHGHRRPRRATAARTIARSRFGFSGIAAPPPRRVTLRTGQPKFRSRWSTCPSPTSQRTASRV